jgi:exosortase/archaeosortase family protein
MALTKGFKQFLLKTGLFLVLFVAISFIIGQKIVASSLLYGFKIFIYGGMGKILLFTIFGFVLLYRDKLLKLKDYKYKKKNIIFLILSLVSVISFYILELNIEMFSPSVISIALVHMLFLSMFIFLGLGIYSWKFIRDFFKEFKKELGYFLIFGIITYSLMNQVWKLWPYLSLIVSKVTYFLLKLVSNNVSLINQYTLSVNGFAAEIGEACSGVYSMFIFTALYLFATILDWKKMNKIKVVLVFIPAIIGAFLANILRVFLLMIIGGYVSRDLAPGLYHSYAGMIFFLIYFAIFWVLFYNWMKKPQFRKKKKIGKVRTKLKTVMNDSLYRNSIYLMLSTAIMSFLGFIFWMIAARLYTTENIGLATAIISVMGLIVGLSVLGLNVGLIRYLPTSKDKNKKINTCFTLVGLMTIIVGSIYLLCIGKFSPALIFIQENILFAFTFLFFMFFASINSLMDSIFTALRNTKYILVKNSIFSILKIAGLSIFVSLGAFGIFTSWMISLIIGLMVVGVVLVKKYDYHPRFSFNDSIIKRMGPYSFGNYVAGFIGGLPLIILPLLILNRLGAETTAYYYMAMMIATLLFVIPQATSQSLFAEGSYDEKDLGKQVRKAIKIISMLLIPGIILIVLFGDLILGLFGAEYAVEGFRFLQLLAVSGIAVAGYRIFEGVLKVRKKIKILIFIGIINAILIIGLSSLLMSEGLMGVVSAWIGGYVVSLIVLLVVGLKK